MKFTITQLQWLKKFYSQTFIKFITIGGINTFIGYGLYLFLLTLTTCNLAYSITFVLSIFSSYLFNLIYVFEERHSLKKSLQFPLIYLFQFIFGLSTLNFLVYFAGMNQKLAPLLIILVSTPITYLLMKTVLTKRV